MNLFDRLKAAGRALKNGNEKRGFFLTPWQYGREHVRPDDMESQVKAYRSWVYVAAQKNAIAFSSVPLRLYVMRKKGAKILVPTKQITNKTAYRLQQNPTTAHKMAQSEDVQEVLVHPFLDIMRGVNPWMTANQLMFDTDIFQELTGNSYWYVFRDNIGPVSIWPLPAQYMHIIPDAENYIGGYKWNRGTTEVLFTPEEVIHFKLPNPNDMYYGMSPLQAARDAYNIQANMNIYQNAVFSNDGRLAGAFETDSVLSPSTFARLKSEIKESFQGAHNAGKMPLLESGIHYKEYALTPRDLDFLNGRRWTQEEIVNAYGQTLALYDKNTTRANSETALYLWMAHTIAPRHRSVEQTITEQIVRKYDESLFVAFDECVPENMEFKLQERKTNIEVGFTTINEERAKEGLPPVPWGDEPIAAKAPPQMQPGEDEEEEVDVDEEPVKRVKKKP